MRLDESNLERTPNRLKDAWLRRQSDISNAEQLYERIKEMIQDECPHEDLHTQWNWAGDEYESRCIDCGLIRN